MSRRPTDSERFITVNGVRLHVLEWPGVGELVLLVHGLSATARSLAGIAEALAPTHRVVAPDLRGRGRSDLLALLDALGIGRVSYLGHSLGALIGVYLAARHPERVGKLVLIDAGTDARPELHAMLQPLVQALDTVYPSLASYLALARTLPAFQPWNRYLEEGLAAGLETLPDGRVRARARRRTIEAEIESQAATRLRALHGQIAAPTLILRATSGLGPKLPPVLTEDEAAAIARAIPSARVVDIPANHYTIAMAGRADVNRELLGFLDGPASAGEVAR